MRLVLRVERRGERIDRRFAQPVTESKDEHADEQRPVRRVAAHRLEDQAGGKGNQC